MIAVVAQIHGAQVAELPDDDHDRDQEDDRDRELDDHQGLGVFLVGALQDNIAVGHFYDFEKR